MPLTRQNTKIFGLLACAFLSSCDAQQVQIRFSTVQEDEERVAAMYAMRAIGVELVTMFEDKKLERLRIRELTELLSQQAGALPTHFDYAPDPKRQPSTAAGASIWTKPDDFRAAMFAFQHKARNLKKVVDATPDAKLDSIWPLLVRTGDSCTACHTKFRVGGDPSND